MSAELPARVPSGETVAASARPFGEALTEDLSFLLARANVQSLSAGNAALAKVGLRVRSYSVLALAADESRPSQRDLADFLRLDPSQVVALVDDLQARGLVTREPDPNDRRANVVVATADGRELCARARLAAEQAEEKVYAGLTAAERERLAALHCLREPESSGLVQHDAKSTLFPINPRVHCDTPRIRDRVLHHEERRAVGWRFTLRIWAKH